MDAAFRAASCFLFLLTICSVHGNIPRVCLPVRSRAPLMLPKLPRAFTAKIVANIVNANFTMLLTEYYDDIANRGAVTRVNDLGYGGSVHEIFDYDSDEVISIDQASGKCVVYPLKDFHAQLFGYRLVDHRLRIKGVSEVLHFGNMFNETYMGTEYVRGILCDHWQACVNTNLVSLVRDYYFASSVWKNPWKNPATPVRAVAKGYGGIPFHHVYDFFSFAAGSPDAKQYDIPRGTFCPGKKNTNNAALPAPKWFSFDSEWVHNRSKSIHHFREFYDADLNLFRVDQRNFSKKPATRGVFKSEIHDYNTGVRYAIYNTTGVKSCKMSVLDTLQHNWDATMTLDSHHVIRLKTSRELLFLTNFSQFGYEGVAKLRGFEADVWSTNWWRSNATAEIYFLRPEWKVQTDAGLEERRTPVRWTVDGRWGHWVSNIYNFDASPQDVNVFDISACYSSSQRLRVRLRFMLDENIVVDENAFRKALRQTISWKAKVTLIRIADIKVFRSPPKFDSLTATFSLLDPPNERIQGVKVNVTKVDSPSGPALEYLNKSVTQKLFVVTFQTPDGTTQKLTADPKTFSIDDLEQSTLTLAKRKDDDDDKVLTKGEVAGLAIGMLILGLILGVVIIMVFKKCGMLDQYDFKRQDNTPTVAAFAMSVPS